MSLNASDLERAVARNKSFVGASVLTFLLYWFFWLPGLIANILFIRDAQRTERMAGETPPGVGCLWVLLLINIAPLALCGLLFTGIVGHNIFKAKERALAQKIEADLKAFQDALLLYHADTGTIPASLADLIRTPRDAKGWDGPYVKGNERALLDPWRREYLYEPQTGTGYTLGTYGSDGQPGGTGEARDVFKSCVAE